ncbi:hypothetical protein OAN12_02610 [Halioglobus sp.]|nr:hypothetical protein [Halioglobus sp.]
MIIRGAHITSRLAIFFTIVLTLIACGGGGGGGTFYDPDEGGGSDPVPPLAIATTALSNAIAGVQYNAVLEATGGKEPYSWVILDDGGTGFTITDGGILNGIVVVSGGYGLTLQVKDSGGRNQVASYVITATGTNTPGALAIATTALPDGSAGEDYNAILGATGGQGAYQWTLLNDGDSGLQLRPDGLLSGTAPVDGQYALTLAVRDQTSSVSSTLILTVGGADSDPLTITTTSLPGAQVNSTYAAIVNAAGGVTPYSWTLVSDGGTGLTLSTAGILSGVPTKGGTFGLVFKVADGTSIVEAALTLEISTTPDTCTGGAGDPSECFDVEISTETLPPADRVIYAASLRAVRGTQPYTWSGGDTNSPGTGFVVDPASGSITGNANDLLPGLYGYTATVVDASGGSDTRSYVIEVPGDDEPPVRIITENPLPDATELLTYSVVMRAVGTPTDKFWDVLETIKDDGTGTLVTNGPSFEAPGSADGGVLFWSAEDVTAGKYLVTIRVKGVLGDLDSSEDVVTFNLEAVPAPIEINQTNPLPNASVGVVDYTEAISSTGGGPTSIWEVLETVPEAGGDPIANGPTFGSPGSASTGILGWAASDIIAGRYRVTIKVTNINDGVTTTDQKTFDLEAE